MFRSLFGPAVELLLMVFSYRRILKSTTRVELAKRYSGSVFGLIWVVLYPAILLSIYLFVYLVIFKMRFPGYSQMHYVLYVFSGLVPYLGLMDALATGTMSVRQNIHVVKNVMLPIELIPMRSVIVSMATQMVALGLLILLVGYGGDLSPHLLWLPLVIVLQTLFLAGIVLILSALAVGLVDIVYFVNLAILFLMFVSPIGFKPEMVPVGFSLMITLNPVYYMAEMFRSSLVFGTFPPLTVSLIYVAMCLLSFTFGALFFAKFKGVLVDYE